MSIMFSHNRLLLPLILTAVISTHLQADTQNRRWTQLQLSSPMLQLAELSLDPESQTNRQRRPRHTPYHGERQNDSYHSGYGFSSDREPRRDYYTASYTSPPLRGGSSRRTRIVENPFSDRLVTGITLTGIDNRPVHLRDIVGYPGRFLLSPLGYTLSQYERPRFINTRHYIDYISVAAKRKEYFTVTFHYD